MLREIKQGVLFTVVTMVLFGGAYHTLMWAVGRALFAAPFGVAKRAALEEEKTALRPAIRLGTPGLGIRARRSPAAP